ncbi:MAG: serine/threonine protein kinase [Sandaracinaceae bacterium]|nr:serine/threonine protein kinase [Sandaracinaceae bacterium]
MNGDRPTAEDTTLAMEDGAGSVSAPRSPSERYEKRGVLGVGGMGEVHLCLDRLIGREVAQKRLAEPMFASKRAFGRFAREAIIHARLEHPAIVPVYDVSLETPESAWFTMKRIHGRSLHEILSALRDGDAATRAEYSRHKLLTAFTQVCLAIDYAHSRGVIHRDLKPSNIMLGGFGEVNVLDWGLAKIVGEPESGSIDLGDAWQEETLAGSLLGTAGYMAPEQARGAVEQVGRAADVYALGTIARTRSASSAAPSPSIPPTRWPSISSRRCWWKLPGRCRPPHAPSSSRCAAWPTARPCARPPIATCSGSPSCRSRSGWASGATRSRSPSCPSSSSRRSTPTVARERSVRPPPTPSCCS